jgi:very-short-patch-repair endonuclease
MTTETNRFKWASSDRYGLLREFAKENRKRQTLAESFLWERLRRNQLGVEFRRQYVIGDYIADFVCLDEGLIIEVDGAYHAERDQHDDDMVRTANLEQIGFKIIRFRNEEVLMNVEKVLESINNELKKLQ